MEEKLERRGNGYIVGVARLRIGEESSCGFVSKEGLEWFEDGYVFSLVGRSCTLLEIGLTCSSKRM